jgi:hypothetical protein
MTKTPWKKGRGKLGQLAPLIGDWVAEADSPFGKFICRRSFSKDLLDAVVTLKVDWEIPKKPYSELCVFGIGKEGAVKFWSFTSDKKSSDGHLADGSDIHPDAVAFEAQMPSGYARQVYWPDEDGAIRWAVESKTKKGWNRFVEHVYRRA